MSDEKQLPPCDAEVFEKGESIGLFPGIKKEDVERLCKGLSAVTGWRIDWSYFAGRPHIRALAPAEQNQGEPVAWFTEDHLADKSATTWDSEVAARWLEKGWPVSKLYTHADPNVRWEAVASEQMKVIEQLRGELGEAKGEYDRSANRVSQLQADLTERDEQIDALRQGMKGDYDLDAWLAFVEEAPQLRMDAGRYRWLRSRDLEAISQGGVFAGLTPDNLVLNEETLDQAIDDAMAKPKCRHCGDTGQIMVGRSGQAEDGNAPIMEPCEDCDRGMPDLASRPEERGTPEAEPCSGCGTPGWTGACNKCIPY